jgi:hypothetical protein
MKRARFLIRSLCTFLAFAGAISVGSMFAEPALAKTPSLDTINATPPFHFRLNRTQQNANIITPSTATPQGLTPSQIRTIYGLPSSGGTGTIALIEAYDNTNAESDLGAFDTQFGLASCTTENGCFEKHKMASTTSTDAGWTLESSLDIQWAHAIAPGAKILVVEAKNSNLTNLLAAVDYARNRSDVVAISMSWDSNEFSGESFYDSHFVSPYGASFFAAAGDSGAGVLWPSVSSNVVSVGGTTLNFNASSTFTSETAWSGSGGGLSAYETEPAYQSSYGVPSAGGFRAVPDVSYNADPNSGYSIYDSTGYDSETGWMIVGGTSAGTPQWAAIHALTHTVSSSNLYAIASNNTLYGTDFRDVSSGTNGGCGYFCTARTGYDYVTGLGSPLTTNFTAPVSYASVTPATGGLDVSIDTTSHAGGTGAWTNISGPTITETASGQIASGVHTLTLPAGWEFNTAQNVTLTKSGGTSLTLASGTITPSATALSFNVTATSTSGDATLAFSGAQIRPTGRFAPSLGNLTHTGAAISGVSTSTSFGVFSIDAGAPVSADVETLADGLGTSTPIQNISAGATTTAYALTHDQFGNFVANTPATWSLRSETGGVVDGDLVASNDTESATFTGHVVGSAIIRAVVAGIATSTDSGIITVVPGLAASLVLSPASANISTAGTAAFTATSTDAYGNSGDGTASTTFSISAGAGGSFSGATYTPQHAGTWIVTGTDGSATATSSLTVTAVSTPPPSGGGGGGGGGGGSSSGGTVHPAVTTKTATSTTPTTPIPNPNNSAAAPVVSAATTGTSFLPTLTRELSVGMSGNDVMALQEFLNTHGFVIASAGPGSPGNESDTFGGKTKSALAAFQAANGINPTGYLGPKTLALINSLLTSAPAPVSSGAATSPTASAPTNTTIAPSAPTTSLLTRNLTLGSSGSDVTALQNFLITQNKGSAAAALSAAGASGYFGQMTRAAVIEYQIAVGILPATGYVGSLTRATIQL